MGPEPDAAEFEQRVREFGRTVFQVAYSVLGNTADAEDVTQDAFLRAYRKYSSLRDPAKFGAWVARMSWRLAVNRHRSWRRAARRDWAWLASPNAMENPELDAAGREFELRLRNEIARLPEKLQAVLLLSGIEGLDAHSVAAILVIPEGTVRSRLHQARRRLLKALSE